MDVQRAKRKGKPTHWIVLPIKIQSTLDQLREVQIHLEQTYKQSRADLRRGFTDLTSDTHVTLFGLHIRTKQTQQLLTRALSELPTAIQEESARKHFTTFLMEIQGLGSWITKGGNIVLYADFSKETQQAIQYLAKTLRDHLYARMKVLESECLTEKSTTGESLSAKSNENDNEGNGEEESRVEDVEAQEDEDNDENDDEEEEDNEDEENDDDEESDEDDDEEDSDAEEDEEAGRETAKLADYFLDGSWMDDPVIGIYVPHITLLNSDPKLDSRLRKQIIAMDGGGLKQERRKGKVRGRDRDEHNGRRHSFVDEESDDGSYYGYQPQHNNKKKEKYVLDRTRGNGVGNESNGWNFALFRDVRKEYSKMTFGFERVHRLELQTGYQCISTIDLY